MEFDVVMDYERKPTLEEVIHKCETSDEIWSNYTPAGRRLTSCHSCNISDEELEILFSSDRCFFTDFHSFLPIIYSLYGFILLLSIPGNVLVIYTVFRFRQLHTVAYIFIANLAFTDLLMVVFCVPFSVTSIMVLQYWPFGKVMCIFVNYVQAISVFGSAYTLVAISIDRYMALVYPLKPRFTIRKAKCIILIVWFMALLTTLPVAIFSEISIPGERLYQFNGWHICRENWPNKNLAEGYTTLLAILQYFLPVVVVIYTYYSIMVAVWGRSSQTAYSERSEQTINNSTVLLRTTSGRKSPHKMMWTILVVVCVYTICWLPFNVFQMIRDFHPVVDQWHSSYILWFIFHWLAMSHTMYNPIILCWMNSKIRTCFFLVFRQRLPCQSCREPLQQKISWSFQKKNARVNSSSLVQFSSSFRRSSMPRTNIATTASTSLHP